MKIKGMVQELSVGAQKFVQMHVLFMGMNIILMLFINTFLLNAYGSFSREVLLYNGIHAAAQPVAMIAAMKLTDKKNALVTQRIAFVFFGLALLVLCVFGEKVSPLYPLFAVILSFGCGYYYCVYSSQTLCYTQDGNRDLISGVIGLLSSVISIFLPLISGLLITWFGARTGYQVVFGIAALLALGAQMFIKHLPELPKHGEGPVLGTVCRKMLRSKSGIKVLIASGLDNCRAFTIPLFMTVLFYNLAPNEFLISLNTTIGYVMALLSAVVYGIVVKKENRVRFCALGAFVVMLPCLAMLLKLNIVMILIFSAVNGFFTRFLEIPVLNTHFKVVEELELHGEYGAEVHFVRELFVAVGRVLGLVLVWAVPQTNAGAVFVLITLVFLSVVNALLLRSIEKTSQVEI